MKRRSVVFAALFLVVSLVGIGCDNSAWNAKETIVIQNRTGMNGVNCYVNAVFQGNINNGQDLSVEGDFEGNVVLFADGPARWGPNTYFIADGGRFVWTLTP